MTSVPTHNNPKNIINLIDQALRNEKKYFCNAYRKITPSRVLDNFKPFINNLSKYSAVFNTYIKIYVYGENFFPYGQTTVDFGSIKNIAISYINQGSFFFEIPFISLPGTYNIIVKNNINLSGKHVISNNSERFSFKSNIVKFIITDTIL
jgi:hypothetical protein